jgi:hypothetical protein
MQPSIMERCDICGEGLRVGNSDGVVEWPGQPGPVKCSVLEQAGEQGLINVQQCPFLPYLVAEPCLCVPSDEVPGGMGMLGKGKKESAGISQKGMLGKGKGKGNPGKGKKEGTRPYPYRFQYDAA